MTLPQDAAEKYPAMYQIFTKLSDNRNIKFIAPQVNTKCISPLKSNYDLTVVKYADNADRERIFSEIKQAARSDQSMKVRPWLWLRKIIQTALPPILQGSSL